MSRLPRLSLVFIPIIVFILIIGHIVQFYSAASSVSLQAIGSTISKTSQSVKAGKWKSIIRLGSNRPTVGKCTVAHGKHNEGYERALETHLAHSEHHGYPTYLLDHPILDGLWSKEAALLEILLEQLSRPEDERLEWLVWFDADTVVMNKLIPIEAFLPTHRGQDIHLLYTKDWNGLNNGVFILRVSNWSLELLSSILAYRTFRPKEKLPFTEQSAMAKVIKLDKYKAGAVQCPPQWFNAYPNDGGDKKVHYDHRPGQLLVHFAGIGDKSKAIGEWLEKLEANRSHWEIPLRETTYEDQIKKFWDSHEAERIRKLEDSGSKKEDARRKLWD